MTETRIERLLQQMSLPHPSDALDARIADCLQASPAPASPEQGRPDATVVTGALQDTPHSTGQDAPYDTLDGRASRASWVVMIVGAAACLLAGGRGGRGMPGQTARAQRWSAGPADQSGGRAAVAMTASVKGADWLDDVRGPRVLCVCAAEVPVADERMAMLECIACHTGLPQARSEFRLRHPAYDGFSTCQVCHTSEVEDL